MMLAMWQDGPAVYNTHTKDFQPKKDITMHKMLLTACMMALALLSSAHLVAAQDTLRAKLTGTAESPDPGDVKGSGSARVTINMEKNEVCYDLSVAEIQEATAAHIHEGAMGKTGPVVVGLEAPKTGVAQGCKAAEAAVIKAIMANPDNYYVNVHNAAFPKGALRGQLAK